MRAINLVPADSRPGRINGGKSGGAVYGLLGGLVLLLLAMSVLAMAKRDESRATRDLATLEQSTQVYTAVATRYSTFEQAATKAQQRISTVRSLAQARFDWAGSMRDLSRLIPATTRISALTASMKADVAVSGGANSQFRPQIASPAITMAGCTKDQITAANLVSQLQAMRRATNVTLESSKKATGDASTGGCTDYEFAIVVFLAPGSAQASTDIVTGTTPATTTTTATESAGGAAAPASGAVAPAPTTPAGN